MAPLRAFKPPVAARAAGLPGTRNLLFHRGFEHRGKRPDVRIGDRSAPRAGKRPATAGASTPGTLPGAGAFPRRPRTFGEELAVAGEQGPGTIGSMGTPRCGFGRPGAAKDLRARRGRPVAAQLPGSLLRQSARGKQEGGYEDPGFHRHRPAPHHNDERHLEPAIARGPSSMHRCFFGSVSRG